MSMQKYTYAQIQEALPACHLQILQRFGWDSSGSTLSPDGKEGGKTRGGTFYLPVEHQQPLVDVALQEVLHGAQEKPLGRNSGPDVAKYYLQPTKVRENLGAWCASFTGWCLRAVFGPDAPYSWAARRLFRRMLAWEYVTEVELDSLQAGDVLLWSRDSAGPYNGHIGIVIGQDEDFVYTIEGNSGPFVRTFRYSKKHNLKRGRDACLGACRVHI